MVKSFHLEDFGVAMHQLLHVLAQWSYPLMDLGSMCSLVSRCAGSTYTHQMKSRHCSIKLFRTEDRPIILVMWVYEVLEPVPACPSRQDPVQYGSLCWRSHTLFLMSFHSLEAGIEFTISHHEFRVVSSHICSDLFNWKSYIRWAIDVISEGFSHSFHTRICKCQNHANVHVFAFFSLQNHSASMTEVTWDGRLATEVVFYYPPVQ